MQFYYITQVGKLIEEVSKRYSFYLLFFIGLTGQTAFGQTAPTMVDQLLAERSSRIAQSVPTRDIDLQLLELGHRPKAIVSTQTLENGSDLTMVDQLLAERSSRIAQSVPTRDIDLQLLELGHRPKAIVSTQTLENGSIRLSFPIYRRSEE